MTNKKAYTFPEIVVATFVSMIILSFIFLFLSNMIEGIESTKREVKILSSFYDFNNQLNNYRNIYTTGGILFNNTSTGSDIFLMEDLSGENGILLGPVELSNYKLNTNNNIYVNKGIGFRKVSSFEIALIKSNINLVYDYIFQKDQIFYDLKVQDIKFINYNSGLIFDLDLIIDLDFKTKLIGLLWENLPKGTLRKFNLNF